MSYGLRPIIVFGGATVAALVMLVGICGAEEKPTRRFDLEVGGGAYISVSSNKAPLDDGWYFTPAAAIQLTERFDLELAIGVGQDHDRVSNNVRTFISSGGGVRAYLNGKSGDIARAFMSVGGTNLHNYRRGGGNAGAAYIGPGVRLMAGESSGLIIKAPFVILPDHTNESLFIPTVSWFYQF